MSRHQTIPVALCPNLKSIRSSTIQYWLLSANQPRATARQVYRIATNNGFRTMDQVLLQDDDDDFPNWERFCTLPGMRKFKKVLEGCRILYRLDPEQNVRDEDSKVHFWSIPRVVQDIRERKRIPLDESNSFLQACSRRKVFLLKDFLTDKRSHFVDNKTLKPFIEEYLEPWMNERGIYFRSNITRGGHKPQVKNPRLRTAPPPTNGNGWETLKEQVRQVMEEHKTTIVQMYDAARDEALQGIEEVKTQLFEHINDMQEGMAHP